MKTDKNILLVGERNNTGRKVIEIVRKSIYCEENIIVTDDAEGTIEKETRQLAEESGYLTVKLNPNADDTDKIHILDVRSKREAEELAGMLPWYLLGDVFMGDMETQVTSGHFIWTKLLVGYALKHQMTLKEMRDYAYRELTVKLEEELTESTSLRPIIKRVPAWRKADDLEYIKETLYRKLSDEKELSMVSTGTCHLSTFPEEKAILYLTPGKSGVSPLITERLMQVMDHSDTAYTIIMDEVTLARNISEHKNAGIVIRFGTDEAPVVNKIKKVCPTTYLCG